MGNAGVLLTRVRYLKQAGQKKFVIVDAGMNDLIRPALYHSYHEIVRVREPPGPDRGDRLTSSDRSAKRGFFCAGSGVAGNERRRSGLALMSAGAYGFVMASNYNSRPLPAEVLVRGRRIPLIRRRQTMADLVRGECE